jgi:hypothetical protein
MSFETRIVALAQRLLSDRTFELIVAPALADLQFERGRGPRRRALNRIAVLRAVAGGLRGDVARNSGSFVTLMLVPACYYIFLLILCFDFFSIAISADFLVVAALILALSFGPVMACFWPERPAAPRID